MRLPKKYFEVMWMLGIHKRAKTLFPCIEAVHDGFWMVIIILGIPRMNMYAGW
jgi:hypothetical protein